MGVSPLDLPLSGLSSAYNVSLRGNYAHTRPPFIRRTLDFGGDSELQEQFEKKFFQGAGYYRPDFGQSSMVAQIGGLLFEVTPTADGATVGNVSIPGDPNDATTNQTWMWQAEKWLIISDGSAKNLIFFDGVSSRRSFGPSQVLGEVVAANPANPPAIGQTIEVTLTDPYTGLYDIPVLFNGAFYQTIAASGSTPSYEVTLTNVDDTPGAIQAAGSDVVVQPGYVSPVTQASLGSFNSSPTPTYEFNINLQSSLGISIGDTLIGTSIRWIYTPPGPGDQGNHVSALEVLAINSSTQIRVRLISPIPPAIAGAGILLFLDDDSTSEITPGFLQKSSAPPNYIVGQTVSNFTSPAVGGTVNVFLTQPYSGASGVSVFINGKRYTIASVPPPAPTTTLTLLNLTDVDADPYALPNDILSVPELPPGRMGAYGQSHVTMSLTDGISFIYGDTVGGPAGTPANNYRDAVLKTTENDFLTLQGAFRIPNAGEIITSMTFIPQLDASLGQGPLQLGTATSIYSCLVPSDRTVWASLTSPILPASLIGKGPLAQDSTKCTNSDLIFRTPDGIASEFMARRDFQSQWGNTPMSREVNPILNQDDQSLLSYGSAVTSDNRRFDTVRPQASNQGVFHVGSVVINYDTVSNLRQKSPAVWEGAWTGVNVLKWISGLFNGVERCFAFAWSLNDQKIELWELLREPEQNQIRDVTTIVDDNGVTPIQWQFTTAALFNPDRRSTEIPLVKMMNGRMHIADLRGSAHVQVYLRADFNPCWMLWHEFDVCADLTEADDSQAGYRTPIGLGEPPNDCAPGSDQPMRIGRFFQVQVRATGFFRFMGADFETVPQPTIPFPAP